MDEEQSDVLKKIKEIILSIARKHGIEVDRVILFGSRARGDYTEDSDWDVLVVTKEEIDCKRKVDFIVKLKILFARLNIPNDIIVKSREELDEEKNYAFAISSFALKEGISI